MTNMEQKSQKSNSEELNYLTREFVKQDCGTNGAILSDRDCDIIIDKVKQLHSVGKFHHTGVYWIANSLAADGLIQVKQR